MALIAVVITAAALFITAREHREFMRQLKARARFRLTVRALDADDDGVIRTSAMKLGVRVELGLKNEGDRAATSTIVNVVIPADVQSLAWCGPNGEARPEQRSDPTPTSETLVDDRGREREGQWISLELPRVNRRTHYVRWFTFSVPPIGKKPVGVPVRA